MAEPLYVGLTEYAADDDSDLHVYGLPTPPGTEVEVWPAGDRTSAASEARAELISIAATLARLSFFAGEDADRISDQSHDNLIVLVHRLKRVADGLPAGDRTKPGTGEWQTYLAMNGWVILDKDTNLPVLITKSDTADEMVRSLVDAHNKAIRDSR